MSTKQKIGYTLNFINAAVGAGILAIPSAFKDAGLVAGLVCCVVLVLVMMRTASIIARKCENVPHSSVSYQSLVAEYLGPRASALVSLSLILYLYGVSIGLFIVVGQQLEDVMHYFCGGGVCSDRRLWIVIFTTAFCFPWTLMPTIDRLQAMGILSSVSCAYVLVLGVAKAIVHLVRHGMHDVKMAESVNIFRALPVFCFAYQLHLQIPLVFSAVKRATRYRIEAVTPNTNSMSESLSLKDVAHSPRNYGVVSAGGSSQLLMPQASATVGITNLACGSALFCCYILYSCFGGAAYLNFGGETSSDVLKNYNESDKLVIVARLAIALTAGVSYPINLFPGRLAMMDILPFSGKDKLFFPITIVWHFSAVGISLVVNDLGVVFEIIGATMGVVMIFVIPACLVLVKPREGMEIVGLGDTTAQKWEAKFLLLIGVVIGVTGVFFIFYK